MALHPLSLLSSLRAQTTAHSHRALMRAYTGTVRVYVRLCAVVCSAQDACSPILLCHPPGCFPFLSFHLAAPHRFARYTDTPAFTPHLPAPTPANSVSC